MIGTKFGFKLDPTGKPGWVGLDSRPEHIKEVAEGLLKRLKSVPSICSINTVLTRTCRSRTWRER